MKRRITLLHFLAISIVAVSCGGSATVTDPPAATTEQVSEVSTTISDNEAVATTSDSETTSSDEPSDSAIDESGPVSDLVVYFDDPGYFDALGADAVRVTRIRNDLEPESVEFDRFGNFHSSNSWLLDGELVQVGDDGYVDAMYAPWLISSRSLEVSFDLEDIVRDYVNPVGETTIDGALRHQHAADPEALLRSEIADHPEWWEWNSATFDVITNPAGAIVSAEYVQDYLWVPVSNMVDPPDPKPTVWTTTYLVEAIEAITGFPDVAEAPDRADQRTVALLDLAGGSFDSLISFEPAVNAQMVTENLELNQSPLLRFGVPISAEIDEASSDVIGLIGGVFLLQSQGGTWFCHAARADAWENRYTEQPDGSFLETVITASGPEPAAVVQDCQTQRDDLREALGLSTWNR